jgi:DNA-binding Lrp family transcriptional regulator
MTLTMKVHPDDPPRKPLAWTSLPTWIADDPTLPPIDKAILLALVGHAWGGKDTAWPSNATIAAKVGRSVGHVKRRLALLEGRGLIAREATNLNRTGRLFRLLWRAPSVASVAPTPRPLARPEPELFQGKKKERPESDSCSGSTPPPAGEDGETAASTEDLEQARRWAAGSDPVLARFGRAALALAGVVDPVIDAPDPVVAWVERESSPEVSPATVAPEVSTPASPASCPPRPPRIATSHRSAPRSRPPSVRRQDPRHVLEQVGGHDVPSWVLAMRMTRSP